MIVNTKYVIVSGDHLARQDFLRHHLGRADVFEPPQRCVPNSSCTPPHRMHARRPLHLCNDVQVLACVSNSFNYKYYNYNILQDYLQYQDPHSRDKIEKTHCVINDNSVISSTSQTFLSPSFVPTPSSNKQTDYSFSQIKECISNNHQLTSHLKNKE